MQKKFNDYQKYEAFKTLKSAYLSNGFCHSDYKAKVQLLKGVLDDEKTWLAVFEHMGIVLSVGESANQELKKAINMLKFER